MNDDKIIDVDTLEFSELREVVTDLLEKLGYEVRCSKEAGNYLCEQFGMTGARGTYDRDE